MAEESEVDPKENPVSDGHLPGAGEVGGPVGYHDPTTIDTNDNPANDPVLSDMPTPSDQPMPENRRTDNVDQFGEKRENPGPEPGRIGNDPTISG